MAESSESRRARILWEAIGRKARSTWGPQVVAAGGEARAILLDFPSGILRRGYRDPALVASVEAAGFRLELGLAAGRPGDVGFDVAARGANDLSALGADPVFFVPHLSLPKKDARAAGAIFDGMASACREAGCALLVPAPPEPAAGRGRTRGHLVGFAVGAAERSKLLLERRAEPGDRVIGVAGAGIHPSGLRRLESAIRARGADLSAAPPGLGSPLGLALLEPREVRVKAFQAIFRSYRKKKVIRGIVQVGEGGPASALASALGDGADAAFSQVLWEVPPVFAWIGEAAGLGGREMQRSFDMGLAFLIVAAPYYAGAIAERLGKLGAPGRLLGEAAAGERGLVFREL